MNNVRYLFTTLCLVLLTGLAGITGSAIASTPDGMTPANEHVCDILIGATPGLFGLCNAYCEAQDLDSIDKEPPRTKILENYRKKMQPGDLDMPCVHAPCPCWTAEQLAEISSDQMAAACVRGSGTIQLIDNDPLLNFAQADTNRSRCGYADVNANPPIVNIQTTIDPSDAQVCLDAVTAACNALGL